MAPGIQLNANKSVFHAVISAITFFAGKIDGYTRVAIAGDKARILDIRMRVGPKICRELSRVSVESET